MEKRTPHCKLTAVKALVRDGKVRTTSAARTGASDMGLTLTDMLDVILALTPSNFYKSMTTHGDHRIWQDVYRAKTKNGNGVYLKLTVIDDLLIVSFKEV